MLACLAKVPGYSGLAVTLLIAGLLSDIFDGIIARRLGVSSTRLRRLDSTADQVFFLAVGAATYLQCPGFFRAHAAGIGILLVLEGATYALSFLRFRREVATHSIGAKIWTLTLVATLVEVMVHCQSNVLFQICLWTGVVTRIEILAILALIPAWTNDVPSVFGALRLRRGLPIRRHKMFNG